jgi:hypothetical protein
MNLSRDQKVQVVAALTEGMSIRAVERLTKIHRDTIMGSDTHSAASSALSCLRGSPRQPCRTIPSID